MTTLYAQHSIHSELTLKVPLVPPLAKIWHREMPAANVEAMANAALSPHPRRPHPYRPTLESESC